MASSAVLQDITSDEIDSSQNLKVYTTFQSMNLKPEIQNGISSIGFRTPSVIQQRAIVPIVSGKDVVAQAQSGTGKTATFSIALLQRLNPNVKEPQVLVLSSTRELAMQIHKVVETLADFLSVKCALCVGGCKGAEDIKQLRKGRQVISGTPGRVYDLVKKKHIKTDKIKMLIMDEADEMLQHGFMKQITGIYKYLPAEVQVVIISATMTPQVLDLSAKFMVEPVKILVKKDKLSLDVIKQYKVNVSKDHWKFNTLTDLYDRLEIDQAIIFCNSKNKVEWLAKEMTGAGYAVSSIHGENRQTERQATLHSFRSGVTRVLITTDVWGRGIDVQGVTHVINYDLPLSKEGAVNKDQYLHRIGRTGRFGREGTAITFVCENEEAKIIKLQKFFGIKIRELPKLELI